MNIPQFYLVANEQAFALDEKGVAFGAYVNEDGTVDWEESSYNLDPCEEDLEYVAHMVQYLNKAAQLYYEQNVYPYTPEAIFVK